MSDSNNGAGNQSNSGETEPTRRRGPVVLFLDLIEYMGNKLPDPAVLFLVGLIGVWIASAFLSNMSFAETVPGTDSPIQINNMLTLDQFAHFLASMVEEFVGFHPLGVVLVALLGVGVAERSGFLNACLKSLLELTPKALLTPMLILVAIVSHTAADAGYVLVIPIGGVMFYAAGRHPLAGIAAAFAGVSGGFSANFIPSGIDPLLAGITQEGANIVDEARGVNPFCNLLFTAISSILIVSVGWFLTDWIVEPRLKRTPIDGDPKEMPQMETLSDRDRIGMYAGLGAILIAIIALAVWMFPANSALRDSLGNLTSYRNSETELGLDLESNASQQLQVAAVAPGGPAAAAGIQPGDLLLSLNNEPFPTDLEAAQQRLAELPAGKPAVVEVSRSSSTDEPADGGQDAGDPAAEDDSSGSSQNATDPAATPGGDGSEATRLDLPLVPAAIPGAPLMSAIVPLIFFLFVIPGLVHGYVSGRFKNHREVIQGMSKTMETMGYYLVLVFFAALFIAAFSTSNIGLLLAVKGANFIRESKMDPMLTLACIILLTAAVNLLVGSASAKWAMLAPIFVPMLMLAGFSPELTQAAYRVGDSTTNIITPMMPYFPLVVVFCQRYYTKTGVGTVAAMMLPFSLVFLVTWSLFLIAYWQLNIPLGLEAPYTYEAATVSQ